MSSQPFVERVKALRQELRAAISKSYLPNYVYSYPSKRAYRPFDPPRALSHIGTTEPGSVNLYIYVPFCGDHCYLQRARRFAVSNENVNLGDLIMAHGVIDYLSNAEWKRLLATLKAHTNPGGFNAYTSMSFSDEYPAPPEFRAAHFLHSVAPRDIGAFYADWASPPTAFSSACRTSPPTGIASASGFTGKRSFT